MIAVESIARADLWGSPAVRQKRLERPQLRIFQHEYQIRSAVDFTNADTKEVDVSSVLAKFSVSENAKLER